MKLEGLEITTKFRIENVCTRWKEGRDKERESRKVRQREEGWRKGRMEGGKEDGGWERGWDGGWERGWEGGKEGRENAEKIILKKMLKNKKTLLTAL